MKIRTIARAILSEAIKAPPGWKHGKDKWGDLTWSKEIDIKLPKQGSFRTDSTGEKFVGAGTATLAVWLKVTQEEGEHGEASAEVTALYLNDADSSSSWGKEVASRVTIQGRGPTKQGSDGNDVIWDGLDTDPATLTKTMREMDSGASKLVTMTQGWKNAPTRASL